jgi:branched-chain amino acid transport system permease protein
MNTALSGYTKAWPFYFGLLFLITVVSTPGGFASVIVIHGPVWRARLMNILLPGYALCALVAAFIGTGSIVLVEMCYHLSLHRDAPQMSLAHVSFDASSRSPWILALFLIGVGLLLLRKAKVIVGKAWQHIAEILERDEPSRVKAETVGLAHLGSGQEVQRG